MFANGKHMHLIPLIQYLEFIHICNGQFVENLNDTYIN